MGPVGTGPGPRAFLDANILFSAALGGESFTLLWALSKEGLVGLVTTQRCAEEAQRNVARKRPEALKDLAEKMSDVGRVPEGTQHLELAAALLPASDAPVLAAAVACGAGVLITGDVRHFGSLMDRQVLPITVMTLRSFLTAGPKAKHR